MFSRRRSVSRVKFVEDPDGFVLPAGQTPLRRELNSRSSPYRFALSTVFHRARCFCLRAKSWLPGGDL